MRRIPHILQRNKKNEMPRHCLFFDTETTFSSLKKETELKFILGTAIYRDMRENIRKTYLYHSKREFWDIVESYERARTRLYLIAHNLDFDFRIMQGFSSLKARGYRMKKLITDSSNNIFVFTKDSFTLYCLDTFNFFKSSLETLGECVGIKKTLRPSSRNISKLARYCLNDTLILEKLWETYLSFLTVHSLGTFASTAAGQAFNAYRHKFMKEDIYIHTNPNIIALERASYHGGRNECFKIGKQTNGIYTMFDVNSMYPFVMKKYLYPAKFLYVTRELMPTALSLLLSSGKAVIAEVELETDEPCYSYKENSQGKLLFPIGRFTATLTTEELRYALSHNHCKKIRTAAVYETKPLFREYVSFFYNLKAQYKKEHNEPFYMLTKLFLNSLYGKFGQHISLYTFFKITKQEDGVYSFFNCETNKDESYRIINGEAYKQGGEIEGYHSFVAIASSITANARMELWRLIQDAGTANVFYCDTDSVIVDVIGCKRLAHRIGSGLGEISVEDKSRSCVIYGNKDYVFGDTIKRKGIKKNAIQKDETTFTQIQFERLLGGLRNKRLEKVTTRPVEKHLSRVYDKGIVDKNGIVKPFCLPISENLIKVVRKNY